MFLTLFFRFIKSTRKIPNKANNCQFGRSRQAKYFVRCFQ